MNASPATPAKFDRRAIALAAWSLVKTAGKTLSEGMKAAWSAAKAPKQEVLEIAVPFSGGNANASQLATLRGLGAQGWTRSTSQFEKRMNYFDMNEAIAAARRGAVVRFLENR